MELSKQEYWSGEPFPSPGDLHHPRIEPGSPTLQADSLPSESSREEKGVTDDEMVDGIIDTMDMSLNKLQEIVKDGEAQHAAVLRITQSWTRHSDRTTIVCQALSEVLKTEQ